MFQVYNKPHSLCSHPQLVYPTPYDSLYISLRDGFDMNTGEPIHKFKSDTSAITLKNKNFSSDNETFDTKHFLFYENIDYEAHLGTKIDYLHFKNLRQLQTSALELLRNNCELERSTILNTLMVSYENPRLAGYNLTRYRSFLSKQTAMLLSFIIVLKFIHPYNFLVSAITENQFSMKMKYISLIQFLDRPLLKPKNNCVLLNIRTYFN